MTRSRVLHCCSRHHFIGLLINYICLCGINAFDLIFTLFTTYNEYLILSLNRGELLGQSISVAQLNALSGLTGKLMNIEFLSLLIEIVKTRTARRQDIVGLKADHVVQKPAEFVNFTFHLDVGSRVLLEKRVVLVNLCFQVI